MACSHTVTAKHRGQEPDTAVSPAPPGSQLGAPVPSVWGTAGAPLQGDTRSPAETLRCIPRTQAAPVPLATAAYGTGRPGQRAPDQPRPRDNGRKGLPSLGKPEPGPGHQGDPAARPEREEPRAQGTSGTPRALRTTRLTAAPRAACSRHQRPKHAIRVSLFKTFRTGPHSSSRERDPQTLMSGSDETPSSARSARKGCLLDLVKSWA